MTFREKLAKEHPECVDVRYLGDCKYCPSDYGYETKSCCTVNCYACWDREMPMTPEEQEQHDLAINAEIIRGYCRERPYCDGCPAAGVCNDMIGSWSAGVHSTSAAKQRAVLEAFEAALPPLDEGDGGRPQAAPTEDNAALERERLDFLYWNVQAEMKDWWNTRNAESLERAEWLLRWMTEIQEGEG